MHLAFFLLFFKRIVIHKQAHLLRRIRRDLILWDQISRRYGYPPDRKITVNGTFDGIIEGLQADGNTTIGKGRYLPLIAL